ncbi:uncharacterized protein AB675_2804 [Cyphellophora attinorum]|uniref:Uncharacterized protein n=1 Tax=Cyphellophora attinorum TaxID=1664694 RepID=A0A0N1HAL2_9EURO|nr:uncharacterized protein AB675_2804 [Phialophora attinorum]KPI45070.1 hypothetical protein AB675_2804 [Phialophora attinorum]
MGESDSGTESSRIPQASDVNSHAMSNVSNSDLEHLRTAHRALSHMSGSSFKIMSTDSVHDSAFALRFAKSPSTSESVSQDTNTNEVNGERGNGGSHKFVVNVEGNNEPIEGSRISLENQFDFNGPGYIFSGFHGATFPRVTKIELWLHQGEVSNISALVIRPRGFPEPLAIHTGFGSTANHSCVVEVARPLCGDNMAEVLLEPRRGNVESIQSKRATGRCVARLLIFDDSLDLKGPSDIRICVKKEAPLQSVISQVYVRDLVGVRPTCEDGSDVSLMLGTNNKWHKIQLRAPSGKDTTAMPLSDSGGPRACGIVTEHETETSIACHHCERISWDPVIEWDHKLAVGPICPHADNGSSGGGGRDGDDLHGDGDHDDSRCKGKTFIDAGDAKDNDYRPMPGSQIYLDGRMMNRARSTMPVVP